MVGRDPEEPHRGASPLELLFDVTFVVAFALSANAASRLVAEGQVVAALVGFGFVMFAVCWAWINYSWFASAFDTDDWFFRIVTMVQMVGVLILALGVGPVFRSIEEGEVLDNGIVVAGYVIMRVAMVSQWLRVARQDPEHRRSALAYVVTIGLAQIGWVVLIVTQSHDILLVLAAVAVLYAIEISGPVIAERNGGGTPWHPHHIAERYGLFAIIAFGEGILGTIAAVSALVENVDWSFEAVAVVVAGTGLTFGLWWMYYIIPAGDILRRRRDRGFSWGYGHIVIFASIAAMGAGLHVAAYVVEGEAAVGVVGAVLSVALPVLAYTTALFWIFANLMRQIDPLQLLLFVGTVVVLLTAVAFASSGVPLGVCLLVIMLAPFVTIVGYETVGHRHVSRALQQLGE